MSAPKWNSNDILQFLEIYERYETLWNTQHKDFLNRNKRERLFNTLVSELQDLGYENLTADAVRKKLKMIKTVYRQELRKIAKSRKTAAADEDVHRPRLVWFAKADSFLGRKAATKATPSSLGLENYKSEVFDAEENASIQPEVLPRSTHNKPQASSIPAPPSNFKRAKIPRTALVNETFTNPHQSVISRFSANDEFQQFANHVATQLRHLPLENALLLQEKIQSLITRERISCLSSSSLQLHEGTKVCVTSPSPSSISDETVIEN